MSYHDLRAFIAALESSRELRRVTAAVDSNLEITAFCQRAQRCDGPALLFEHAGPSRHRFLGNVFGSVRRIEMALGRRPVASLRELGELLAELKEPRWPGSLRAAAAALPIYGQLALVAPKPARSAPFQFDRREGPDVDLAELPIQTCWPEDAAPLITLGLVITRSHRLQRQNIGIYRMQLLGRNRVVMRWLAHRGGAQDHAEWCEQHPADPFPVAVAIGADPATTLAAVAPLPDTLSEFEFAGLLRGARGEVLRSDLTGLDLPASAEIVLEGHIQPGDTALEGPFGDHTGYYNAVDRFPVFTVDRMCRRDGAIYQGSWMGRSPHDEPSVLAMALNDLFIPILRRIFPEVVDFYLPPAACSYRVAVVSIRKRYPGHARRVMFGVWSYLRQFTYTKFVIVTDDDIDVRNWDAVLWAISTRVDPARDCLVVDRTPVDYLDFASPDPNLGGKLGIDATTKVAGETHRAWGRPIRPDPLVEARVDALWAQTFGASLDLDQ